MDIVAFHGDFASPAMLKEDIGPIGLDITFSRATDWTDAVREGVTELVKPVGIGYSRGDAIIADLSVKYPDLFSCVVLYEGPLGRLFGVGGSFPALIIWNDQGVKAEPRGGIGFFLHLLAKKRQRMANEKQAAWEANGRKVSFLQGSGKHVNVDPSKRPRFRHGWDQSLNSSIEMFIRGNAHG